MASTKSVEIPSSVLIIGSGVFGLSTAYSLCKHPLFKDTSITLVDRQPFPTPDGSSIDTSRIIRADYASHRYARLATLAITYWRTTFAPSYYHENGLCITASGPEKKYVSESLANIQALGTDKVEVLSSPEEIRKVCGLSGKREETEGSGSTGYVNWSSGWADAEGSMRWLRSQVESFHRVTFITATVTQLLIDHSTKIVSGARIKPNPTSSTNTTTLTADLTILAAGAWTPSLLDLRGIAQATGQILTYLPITPTEQTILSKNPTLLNLSTGLFLIPPSHNLLKIARHGHGYTNPTTIPHPEYNEHDEDNPNSPTTMTISLPYTHINDPTQSVPNEGLTSTRAFLAACHPNLCSNPNNTNTNRPFTKSRICWYTDTRSGDFLIDYHPGYKKGLFVATGGSGHAFKFLPVIGDSIVECMLGNTPEDFKGKWEWPVERVPEGEWEGDGSRGGPVGMVLGEEMAKMGEGSKL